MNEKRNFLLEDASLLALLNVYHPRHRIDARRESFAIRTNVFFTKS